MENTPDVKMLKSMGLVAPDVLESDLLVANIAFKGWLPGLKSEIQYGKPVGIARYTNYGPTRNEYSYINSVETEGSTEIQVNVVQTSPKFCGNVPTFSILVVLRAVLINLKTAVAKYAYLLMRDNEKTFYPKPKTMTESIDYNNTYLFLGWTGAFARPMNVTLEEAMDVMLAVCEPASIALFSKRIIGMIRKKDRTALDWSPQYNHDLARNATSLVRRIKVTKPDCNALYFNLTNLFKFHSIGRFPLNKSSVFDTGFVLIVLNSLFTSTLHNPSQFSKFMAFYNKLTEPEYHKFIASLSLDLGLFSDENMCAARNQSYIRCGLSFFGTEHISFDPMVEFMARTAPLRGLTASVPPNSKDIEEFKDYALKIAGGSFIGIKGCTDVKIMNPDRDGSPAVLRTPGTAHLLKWLEDKYFGHSSNSFQIYETNDVYGYISELFAKFSSDKKMIFIVPNDGFVYHTTDFMAEIQSMAWSVKTVAEVVSAMLRDFMFSDTIAVFLWAHLLSLGEFTELTSLYRENVFKDVYFVGTKSFSKSAPGFTPFFNNLCERYPDLVIHGPPLAAAIGGLRELAQIDAFAFKTMAEFVAELKRATSTSITLNFNPSLETAVNSIASSSSHLTFANSALFIPLPNIISHSVWFWTTALGIVFQAHNVAGEGKLPICWCDLKCPSSRRMECGRFFVKEEWFASNTTSCLLYDRSVSALALGLYPMTPAAAGSLLTPDQYRGSPVVHAAILVAEGGSISAIVEAARHCISRLTIYFPFLEHDDISTFRVARMSHSSYPLLKLFSQQKRSAEQPEAAAKRRIACEE